VDEDPPAPSVWRDEAEAAIVFPFADAALITHVSSGRSLLKREEIAMLIQDRKFPLSPRLRLELAVGVNDAKLRVSLEQLVDARNRDPTARF
jgi:hypothetical protein